MVRSFLLALVLFGSVTWSAFAAHQQRVEKCFSRSVATAEITTPTELTFNFPGNAPSNRMVLCDGQSYHSANIDNASLILVGANSPRKRPKKFPSPVEYFDFTYHYYNGNGSWGKHSSQPITITLQDKNHHELMTNPVFHEDTPRERCWYGRGTDENYEFAMPRNLHFHDIAYATITIPRVAGRQGGC